MTLRLLLLAVVDLEGELGWNLIRLLAAVRSDSTSSAQTTNPAVCSNDRTIRCHLEQQIRQSEQSWRGLNTNDVCYGELAFGG